MKQNKALQLFTSRPPSLDDIPAMLRGQPRLSGQAKLIKVASGRNRLFCLMAWTPLSSCRVASSVPSRPQSHQVYCDKRLEEMVASANRSTNEPLAGQFNPTSAEHRLCARNPASVICRKFATYKGNHFHPSCSNFIFLNAQAFTTLDSNKSTARHGRAGARNNSF